MKNGLQPFPPGFPRNENKSLIGYIVIERLLNKHSSCFVAAINTKDQIGKLQEHFPFPQYLYIVKEGGFRIVKNVKANVSPST